MWFILKNVARIPERAIGCWGYVVWGSGFGASREGFLQKRNCWQSHAGSCSARIPNGHLWLSAGKPSAGARVKQKSGEWRVEKGERWTVDGERRELATLFLCRPFCGLHAPLGGCCSLGRVAFDILFAMCPTVRRIYTEENIRFRRF